GPWPGTAVQLNFGGNLAGLPLNALTINAAGLTGGTPSVTHTTVGETANWYRCAFLHTALASGTTHTLVVTLVSGTLTLDEVETFTAEAPTAGRFTIAGHSIAAGIGATPATARFSLVLAGYLALTEDNQALSGEGLAFGNNAITSPGWQRLNPATGATLWHDRTPQTALIMYGYNDVRTNPDGTATALTGSQLAQFIQRLRELLLRMQYNVPSCKVAVLGNPYGVSNVAGQGWQQPNFALASAVYGLTWTRAIAALCGERGITNAMFCDVFPTIAYNGDASLLVDGSHPNATGHGLMANTLRGRLQIMALGAQAGHVRGAGAFR
ncbi:MAG: SGNH/GDSL hydrolase family protein, partial [Thermomicrobia bacterium]|nr:SGNH/GDSL hydrolase family protein [Thermomicrobia bacterium]